MEFFNPPKAGVQIFWPPHFSTTPLPTTRMKMTNPLLLVGAVSTALKNPSLSQVESSPEVKSMVNSASI